MCFGNLVPLFLRGCIEKVPTALMSAAPAALDSNFLARGEKRSAPPACSSSSPPAGLSLSISREERSGPCQNGPLANRHQIS